MRETRFQAEPPPKPNLTPMIDIVFLLMVFFMVVSQLATFDLEEIELPKATQAQPPDDLERSRPLPVNVLADGRLKVRGRTFAGRPGDERFVYLGDHLELEAACFDREPWEGPGNAPSSLKLNLRADADVPFGRVHEVLDAAQRHGIYKTSLAASPDPE